MLKTKIICSKAIEAKVLCGEIFLKNANNETISNIYMHLCKAINQYNFIIISYIIIKKKDKFCFFLILNGKLRTDSIDYFKYKDNEYFVSSFSSFYNQRVNKNSPEVYYENNKEGCESILFSDDFKFINNSGGGVHNSSQEGDVKVFFKNNKDLIEEQILDFLLKEKLSLIEPIYVNFFDLNRKNEKNLYYKLIKFLKQQHFYCDKISFKVFTFQILIKHLRAQNFVIVFSFKE